jgi:RNA polymerase sigma-70 factor (ECF subfamily)
VLSSQEWSTAWTRTFFQSVKPLVFSIAYRMLGSASDAEDVLQDAWLRCRAVDFASIRSPAAFMTTTVTCLCLDRLKSARTVREQYIGPWLPEPVLTSELERPDAVLERAESVTLAFLVLLERLSPQERAVFLLKEVFDYEHGDIAGMLDTTAENSRQLLHRARTRLARSRPRLTGTVSSRRAVAERFAQAFSSGNPSELAMLLASDAGMWSDGGGKAIATRRPLLGSRAGGPVPGRPPSHGAIHRPHWPRIVEYRGRQRRACAGRSHRRPARIDLRPLTRRRRRLGDPHRPQS